MNVPEPASDADEIFRRCGWRRAKLRSHGINIVVPGVQSLGVRAPRWVEMVSTTVYLSGESSCATGDRSSPQEANASCVEGIEIAGVHAFTDGPLATILPS